MSPANDVGEIIDNRILRFLMNGVAAAGVHFLVLFACLELVGMRSAGMANLVAACAGISASFLGSRYFVFQARSEPAKIQAARFLALYGAMALMHGAVLFAWTDVAGLDYRVGFLFGTALQALCTYLGGRHWVFKAPGS